MRRALLAALPLLLALAACNEDRGPGGERGCSDVAEVWSCTEGAWVLMTPPCQIGCEGEGPAPAGLCTSGSFFTRKCG